MEVSPITLLKLVSFLFWTVLYTWCSLKAPEKSPEWCSRVVTLLHGTVASIVGVAQCGVFTVDKCRLTAKLMPRHYALMVWSWGYFAFDLLWCLLYWGQNKLMLLHHASALFAINVYMGKDYTGCVFACTLAFMEVTNPLLQMRWFLRNEGHQQSFLYLVVEATYLTLFLGLRGVLGTYLIFKALASEIFDKEEKLICLVFYFVSMGFIYEIIGYVFHKYKTKIGSIWRWMEEIGLILNEQH